MQKVIVVISICLSFFVFGCGVYSHTGASVPPDASTVSVAYIANVASIVNPLLSQNISEKLKQKFVNETPLKLVTTDGDINFVGKITNYEIRPAAITGNQTNALNRLTITIEITFENKKAPDKNFTRSFSNITDFSATDNFQAREAELSGKVVDMLVQDVFNAAFINW
ncbi:MAG: LPS assembly lipoprotein LptE [Bacteroidota bacterium]